MGWLNINGNWIGRNSGVSWSKYWTSQTFVSVQPATVEQVSLVLKATVGSDLTLNWGDGSADVAITADGHDHTYTSNYSAGSQSYNIVLTGILYKIKKFKVVNNSTLSINLDSFEHWGLDHLELDTLTGNIAGTINKLPSTLAYLRLNTIGSLITGSINNLPSDLVLCDLIGHPLITGSLQNLSQSLMDLQIEDCPLVAGSINTFGSHMRSLYLSDLAQTITGTLENLPKKCLTQIALDKLGTGITGSLDNLTVTDSVFYGDINYLILNPTSKTDAIDGSFSTLMTNNDGSFVILRLVNCGDDITGDLDDMPAIVTNGEFTIVDSGTLTYSGGTLPAIGYATIKIHCGLIADELDDFLIEFAARSSLANYHLFDLAGNNEGHTSASDTAIDALVAEYRNVFLNDPATVTNFDIDLSINANPVNVSITIGSDRKYKVAGIDWGDGTVDYITSYHVPSAASSGGQQMSHVYASTGTKNIKIKNAYGLSHITTLGTTIKSLSGDLDDFAGCDFISWFNLQTSGGNMTGSLASVASAKLIRLYCDNLGAAPTLNLDDLGANAPNLTVLYCYNFGSGNVTGKISSLPTALTTLTLYYVGNAYDIKTGTMPAWAGTTMQLVNSHPSADVDAFLISWAATAGAGTKTITLTRSRTSASDAAVAILNGLGKTINTSG